MKRVVLERRKLGLSQAKLAQLADTNPSCMSRIEAGKEPPYPLRSQRIANALGWKDDPALLFEEVNADDIKS